MKNYWSFMLLANIVFAPHLEKEMAVILACIYICGAVYFYLHDQ